MTEPMRIRFTPLPVSGDEFVIIIDRARDEFIDSVPSGIAERVGARGVLVFCDEVEVD